MPDRSHDARNPSGLQENSKPSKPRRFLAGLALPTAASLALIFGATGVAVATSNRPPTVADGQTSSATVTLQLTAAAADMRVRHIEEAQRIQAAAQGVARASRLRTVANNQLAVVRVAAVARGVQRKNLYVRLVAARRAAMAHSWQLPIRNPVTTSGFGYRWGRLHAGEDFGVSVGTPLASMSTGTVVFAGAESGYGNLVQIRYWDGTISYFGHMSRVSVRVGQAVDPGQIVGRSGNTGHSTGPHLHLEIHPHGGKAINPLPWLAAHHIAY